MATVERRNLKEDVKRLRKFRIFSDSNLKDSAIEKISKYMEKQEFTRGRAIYREGETSIDGVYFISAGDFEIT